MRSTVCDGVLRVQGGEDEVAGLGGGQRRLDRLEVAHFADEDHVGVLAKRGLERHREADRVAADLTLVDDARAVRVEELDRVLDRHDVLVTGPVDPVDHRGERRRLARAGRARDEHEAARLGREVLEDRREAELLELRHLAGDQAERGADRGALEVRVDAEARAAGIEYERSICHSFSSFLPLVVREDRVDDLAGVLRAEGREVERGQVPALADHGWDACRDVEVGRAALHHLDQDIGEVEVHRGLLGFRCVSGLVRSVVLDGLRSCDAGDSRRSTSGPA